MKSFLTISSTLICSLRFNISFKSGYIALFFLNIWWDFQPNMVAHKKQKQITDILIMKEMHQSICVMCLSRGYCILPNKCMQISHWIILSSVSSICLFVCPVQQSPDVRNEQKQYSNPETDEDKWSHGALFWLFSLCQFRDSTVDSRHTCYCAVTICHFCTVIVSFCGNASELIWAESIRTEKASSAAEMEKISLLSWDIWLSSLYWLNICIDS